MLDEKYIVNRIRELCDKKQLTMSTFYTLNRICDGLGITLPQFFSDDIGKLELSSEQKKVLDTWQSLTDREKEAVEIYVRGMKLK